MFKAVTLDNITGSLGTEKKIRLSAISNFFTPFVLFDLVIELFLIFILALVNVFVNSKNNLPIPPVTDLTIRKLISF